MNFLREIGRLLYGTYEQFTDDNCARTAAALSYYTVFSMPAVMVIVVSVAGFFFDPEDVRGRVRGEIRNVVGEAGADQVQTMIAHANQPGRGILGTVGGIAALVFGATGVMTQLQAALNEAWNVRPHPDKSLVKYFFVKRLVSLGMVLGMSFVLIVSLLVSTLLTALRDQIVGWLPAGVSHAGIVAANLVVAYLLLTLIFAVMFKFLPDARVPWEGVWWGAALTALLFGIGKWALGLYLSHSDVASTYGAAGSLVLILVWVYYSGIIFLFGAEFTQVFTSRSGATIKPEPGAQRVPAT